MARLKKIAIEGCEGTYEVIEDLGYSHSTERYAKAVTVDGRERIVVARTRSGPWRFNRPVVDVGGIARQVSERKERGEL